MNYEREYISQAQQEFIVVSYRIADKIPEKGYNEGNRRKSSRDMYWDIPDCLTHSDYKISSKLVNNLGLYLCIEYH